VASAVTSAFKTLRKLPDRLQYLIVSCNDDLVVLSDEVVQYSWPLTHLLRARFTAEVSLLVLVILPLS
jgi:hypothetical protein